MINLLYPNYEDEQQLFIYLKKYMMRQQEKKKQKLMNPILKLAYAVVPLHSDLRFALLLQHFLVVAVSETILLAVLVGKLQEYLGQL